jgi:hypothetical protein
VQADRALCAEPFTYRPRTGPAQQIGRRALISALADEFEFGNSISRRMSPYWCGRYWNSSRNCYASRVIFFGIGEFGLPALNFGSQIAASSYKTGDGGYVDVASTGPLRRLAAPPLADESAQRPEMREPIEQIEAGLYQLGVPDHIVARHVDRLLKSTRWRA